jgi:hypothetical protein
MPDEEKALNVYVECSTGRRKELIDMMTRKGVRIKLCGTSIVECLILMIVMMVVVGALLTELTWSTKNYISAKQGLMAREILFNWVQTFESLWPDFYTNFEDACREATTVLNGTWDAAHRLGRIDGMIIETVDKGRSSGALRLGIRIYAAENSARKFLELDRRYNLFSNEVVSDNVLL